ncbi:MAG TPA: outer membrane beta-barrel protein [Candidatus Binatia bacterium]|nr:outer membrane beta-barrel protein [Candidatus Binatia bacterium]
MKIGVIAMAGMLSLAAGGLGAAEIDSKVIHNYNYFGLGYGYLHDIGDLDVDGHGPVGELSFEQNNFVLNVSGGYFWVTDTGSTDVNLWDVTASIGYVVRLMENHFNIIPRFGGAYSGIQVDDSSFGNESDETWSILPGVGVSYAINNRFAINGGYTYAYNFDSEDEDHLFTAGAKFAILDQVGLSVNGNFSKEFGFTGITAMLEFHY